MAPASPQWGCTQHLGAGHPLFDVVDLGLDRGQVVLGPALQDEALAQGGHAGNLHHVLPHVLGQHLRQTGEQLLLRVALLLEVHPIGIEENRAAVAEARRQGSGKGGLGVFRDGHAELIRHRLQQHAVAGRALVGQAEVLDVALV